MLWMITTFEAFKQRHPTLEGCNNTYLLQIYGPEGVVIQSLEHQGLSPEACVPEIRTHFDEDSPLAKIEVFDERGLLRVYRQRP